MSWDVWKPSRVRRVDHVIDSSMNTVVVTTDNGRGYLKAIGNAKGEHALDCELIGSSLAEWLGLPGLDLTTMNIDADGEITLDADDSKQLNARRRALPGPAFRPRGLSCLQLSGQPHPYRRHATNKRMRPRGTAALPRRHTFQHPGNTL